MEVLRGTVTEVVLFLSQHYAKIITCYLYLCKKCSGKTLLYKLILVWRAN